MQLLYESCMIEKLIGRTRFFDIKFRHRYILAKYIFIFWRELKHSYSCIALFCKTHNRAAFRHGVCVRRRLAWCRLDVRLAHIPCLNAAYTSSLFWYMLKEDGQEIVINVQIYKHYIKNGFFVEENKYNWILSMAYSQIFQRGGGGGAKRGSEATEGCLGGVYQNGISCTLNVIIRGRFCVVA